MKTFIVTLLVTLTLVVACGGRELVPDCHGDVFCRAPDDFRAEGGYCCPSAYPYCGEPNTNCPVGKCCNAPPQ